MNAFRQTKDAIYREEGNEAIIFNPENANIIVINSTGRFIWSLLDGKHSKKDIMKAMANEFDVAEEIAQKDLDIFICNLQKKDFVEKVEIKSSPV